MKVKSVALLDYGAGNLHSLAKALESADRIVTVEQDPFLAITADLLVLPGVGAFGAAAAWLAPARDAMRQALLGGLPCFGVCLGMQLLFDGSDESAGAGLGLISGRVTRLNAQRVPQIGWNELAEISDASVIRAGLTTAYYANSYVGRPVDTSCVTAWSIHEADRFPASVRFANTLGVQFHPEKSSRAGLMLVRDFVTTALKAA